MPEPMQIVTDGTFQALLASTSEPVVVHFQADWCNPCKMLAPILDELILEYQHNIVVATLNVDENKATTIKSQVNRVPTLVVYRNGQELGRFEGFKSKKELKESLDKVFR